MEWASIPVDRKIYSQNPASGVNQRAKNAFCAPTRRIGALKAHFLLPHSTRPRRSRRALRRLSPRLAPILLAA
ncbi:hypothetical protein AXX16_0500 [Serratia rubidaea]|nr:hypothetical protein AXX16_0500 [Serratia rubidaea]